MHAWPCPAGDIQVVPMFGMNMIRLHQKVNPERWYYHADKIGVLVFQVFFFDSGFDFNVYFGAVCAKCDQPWA